LCSNFTPERGSVDEVDEGALPADLDHRQPLTVASLQLGIAGDVHLFEVEAQLRPRLLERRAGPLAEVAARRMVENDLDRYG